MSKTKRDGGRKFVKQQLLMTYGRYCWLCMKRFDTKRLTLHHVIPFHISKTTTFKDSMILCEHCHFEVVNKVKYGSKEYNELMAKARKNINKHLHSPNEEVDEPDD